MRGRVFISSIICVTILFSLTGCMKALKPVAEYFNKDSGMLDWDDENTIRIARILDTNPKGITENQQKQSYYGYPLIRYDAVYDETEGLLFIYGKFHANLSECPFMKDFPCDCSPARPKIPCIPRGLWMKPKRRFFISMEKLPNTSRFTRMTG